MNSDETITQDNYLSFYNEAEAEVKKLSLTDEKSKIITSLMQICSIEEKLDQYINVDFVTNQVYIIKQAKPILDAAASSFGFTINYINISGAY